MPIHLPGLTRRQFLVAAGGVLVLRPDRAVAADVDPHRLALVSDTHVPSAADTLYQKKWDMTANLRKIVGEITALNPRPATMMVDGDLAYQTGLSGDYKAFGELIEPVRKVGIPVQVGLGNHDAHAAFNDKLAQLHPAAKPVEGKHVLIIELERANLFMLDSLDIETPKVEGPGGRLGVAQLKWLATALDIRPNKPALVFAHHNPQPQPSKDFKWHGLADTEELMAILLARKQVKAYVFGHTHTWKLDRRDGMHLINLPAAAYPFQATEWIGWVDAKFGVHGATFVTRSLAPEHKSHNKAFELTWRT